MSLELQFDYIWIPSCLGGHNTSPYEGMRTTIRWQRYVNEYLQNARDVQWKSFNFNPETLQGSAICQLISDSSLPEKWLKDGELIELLSGFRVLAVGKIRSDDRS